MNQSFHGISTAKADVTTPESPDKVKSVENSPDKWWFLHERPNALPVCRELRSRPYSERLDLISMAPCPSDRHVTVLHLDGAERDAVNPARRERSTMRSRKLRPPKEQSLRTWLTGVLRYAVKTLLESVDAEPKYRKIPKIGSPRYKHL